MEKIAFLFTSQGTQYVGMAKSFHNEYAVARQTFEEASDVLNFDIAKLWFEEIIEETSTYYDFLICLSVIELHYKEFHYEPEYY